jgi:type IV pilus assembly protein PilE
MNMPGALLLPRRFRLRGRGFTLVEALVTLGLVALMATFGVQGLQGQRLKSGRVDAVNALTRVQIAQEQYRSAHGLYAAELQALQGTAATSPEGRYAIVIEVLGAESYRATAIARGAQAADSSCTALTLEVRQGFAQNGPDAGCWNR